MDIVIHTNAAEPVYEQITFETSAEGRVLAVVLHQNGVDQRARHID